MRAVDAIRAVLSGVAGCALDWSESDNDKIRYPKTHRLLRQHSVIAALHR